MAQRTQLGKITIAHFGFVPDQAYLLGLQLCFSGEAWGVYDYVVINISKGCQWVSLDQKSNEMSRVLTRTQEILEQAKVHTVEQLTGKPVEVTFEGTTMLDWRILTEVL